MSHGPKLRNVLQFVVGLVLAAALGGWLAGHSPGFSALAAAAAALTAGLVMFLARARGRLRVAGELATSRVGQEHLQTAASAARSADANQLKDESLSVIVHELRNPLSPILIWTQLLRAGALDAEKTQRALEAIERSVAAQTRLIDELLDLSRAASGALRLDLRPVDLKAILHLAGESLRAETAAKRIRQQIVADGDAGLVMGDPVRLQQAIRNVLANALASTPEDGLVRVVLKRVSGQVELSVSDSGANLTADTAEHPFEPYRRDAEGAPQRSGRLALGLAIARHIVELHGGQIAALSEGPGLGWSLRLRLPVLAALPAASAKTSTLGSQQGSAMRRLDDLHILVVDDDPMASEALRMLLHSRGAEVQVAMCVRDALATLSTWKVDVLVSDIVMPEQDGVYLVRELRRREMIDHGNLPALALTGFSNLHDPDSVMAAGFQMCLEKPADPTALVAAVADLAQSARG